jgi:hypothetical protein
MTDSGSILPKVLFILATAAGASWGRFSGVWFNQKGIPPSLNTMLKASGFVAKSMAFCNLCDC